jgi:hypothetical protein
MKIIGTMAFRQNQHMVKADGRTVLNGKCGFVLKDDAEMFGLAEGANPALFVL